MGFGRSLELYFVDGRPEGLLTARVFNWTGQVLKVPRTQLRDALLRPEASYTGVYVLIGERDGLPLAYIGEGEEVAARIRDHDGRKDWWTTALIVTTAGDDLNKAHVKYLESRLVEKAKIVGVSSLENGNVPPRSSLSEAGVANMEEFLDTLFIVFPALGVDLFNDKRRADPVKSVAPGLDGPKFSLVIRDSGVHAFAVVRNGEFIVQKGSLVRNVWDGSTKHGHEYIAELHRSLISSGVIATGEASAVFMANYAFGSPSLSASIVAGRVKNGRREWKLDGTTKTYGEWDTEQLAMVPL